MSLLMKALKKAEESQQGRPHEEEPTLSELSNELSLEPVVEHSTPGQKKMAERKNGEIPAAGFTQHSAANLFAAKDHEEGGRHSRLLVMLSIGALLFLIGGSVYVYIAINKPELLLFQNRPAAAPVAVAPPPPAEHPTPPPMPEAELAAPVAEPLPEQPAQSGQVLSAAIPARERMAAQAQAQTAAEPVENDAIKVLSNKQKDIIPELAQAWQALQDGQLETARMLYQRLLRQEPRNVDLLLGMATVMARTNATSEAGRLYLRALDIEPKNIYAQAGLMNVLGGADPAGSEARLKQLLAEQPAAFLHFALGNLYSGRGRWNEAQQAYFEAHRMESDNPDYAFNLAVSLEQINQPKPALNYYQRALALQQRRSAGFDRAAVEARIVQLKRMAE